MDINLLKAGNLLSILASEGNLLQSCGPLHENAHLPNRVLLRGTTILIVFDCHVNLPVTLTTGTKKPDKLERPSKYIDLWHRKVQCIY